ATWAARGLFGGRPVPDFFDGSSMFQLARRVVLALAFLAPLVACPVAEASLAPVGLLALLALFGLVLAKAWPRRPATLLTGADCAPL
ncbi:MAG: hypothetical protein K2Q06_05025, partial [Parvularculaceae bacterium]|nr:hypothetical protein [Parvularculaceae bacterium]